MFQKKTSTWKCCQVSVCWCFSHWSVPPRCFWNKSYLRKSIASHGSNGSQRPHQCAWFVCLSPRWRCSEYLRLAWDGMQACCSYTQSRRTFSGSDLWFFFISFATYHNICYQSSLQRPAVLDLDNHAWSPYGQAPAREIHHSLIAMFTTKCHHSTWQYSSWQFPREAGNWCSSAWFNAGRSSAKIWFNSEILRRVVAASRGPQAGNKAKAKAFFGKAIFQSKHSERSRQCKDPITESYRSFLVIAVIFKHHTDATASETPKTQSIVHDKTKTDHVMLSTQGQRYTQSWRSLAQDTPVSLVLTVGHINVNLSLENHWYAVISLSLLPRWWTTLHSLHNFCNSSTVLQPAARDTKKVSGHGGRRTHKRTSLLQGSWRHCSVSGVRRVTNHQGVDNRVMKERETKRASSFHHVQLIP